jgi:hypothetical protein
MFTSLERVEIMETKPGIYTTEFWVTILTAIVPFLNLVGIWNWASNWHAGILLTILGAVYTVARGVAKQGVAADPTNANTYRLVPKKHR